MAKQRVSDARRRRREGRRGGGEIGGEVQCVPHRDGLCVGMSNILEGTLVRKQKNRRWTKVVVPWVGRRHVRSRGWHAARALANMGEGGRMPCRGGATASLRRTYHRPGGGI